ncbi:hypothetical protein [Maribellus mangrovi]|uniref:hypothetical protein n=1 Tax=Maribellus mangrovi TaxID=3133146 RepID=UPI0030ED138E
MNSIIKIKIKGHLNPSWKDWFDGLDIVIEGDHTILLGDARDEAFIYGVINKIRDLNLKLISVEKIDQSNQCHENN